MNAECVRLLGEKNLTLALAESLTGGLLADAFVRVPGASKVFLGSVVAYTDAVKRGVLDVPAKVLEEQSAVSAKAALCMARGVWELMGADIALSATGYAGPGGKDPGLFFVALCTDGRETVRKYRMRGTRGGIRKAAAAAAVTLLYTYLKG
jgi:PncC family amidohydrolase